MNDAQLRKLVRRIDREIERRKDRFVAFLCGLLRFETVSGAKNAAGRAAYRREVDRCLKYLQNEAERLGMAFRNYDGLSAVAELKGSRAGATSVGVALHIDVVPAGANWTHPPFGGEVSDGAVWGRGAQDDKGPTAMALSAIETLLAVGVKPARSIRLLFGTQEEGGDWADVELLIAKGEAGDVTLVPDGGYPIINGEKGMINVKLRAAWPPPTPIARGRRAASAVGPRFVSLTSGERANMVPDRATLRLSAPLENAGKIEGQLASAARSMARANPDARIQIERAVESSAAAVNTVEFELTFHGKSAHGSRPEAGHNAALDALQFLSQLAGRGRTRPAANQVAAPALLAFAGMLTKRASRFDASGFNCACHHDHLGDSTANLGILNMDERGGRAVVNIRFPLGLDLKTIVARFKGVAREFSAAAANPKLTARMAGKGYEPLFVSPDEHPEFLSALQRAYETATGRKSALHSIAGTTYAKAYPLAVAFGPVDETAGEKELAHQADERVTIQRHLENIKIYTLALALLSGE